MNREEIAWQKLVSASRRVQDHRDLSAPYGFATRLAALALGETRLAAGSLFERWSWRALALAGMFAAVTVANSYSNFTPTLADDLIADETTVATLFD